jgi:hypothetical protein
VDDLVAISELPYRRLDAAEAAQLVLGDAVVAAVVGDEQKIFGSLAELDDWSDRTRAAETQLPSPFGKRSVLFVRIDFSDAPGAVATDTEYNQSMYEVDRFYREMSADRVYFAGNIIPGALRSAKTKAFYNSSASTDNELMAEAIALAKSYDSANGASGKYNPDLYDHVMVLFSKMSNYTSDVTPEGWAGEADTGGKRIWLNGYWDSQTIAHEIGHNLGLYHGYAWKPSTSSPIGLGTHVEYGDPFDAMGSSAEKPLANRQFSVPKKRALGLVSDLNLTAVQNSGQFRIYRHDGSAGTKIVGLKIGAGSAYDYWIEYRKALPSDLSGFSSAAASGVQVRWNSLPSFTKAGAKGTYLLDMTPGSAGDMKDGMLTLGQSFYDSTYKIRITPIKNGTDADGDWIDVAVVFGDFPVNRAPSIQSASTAETAFARVAVNLVAKATDPDGDTVLYQWDCGDGTQVYSTSANIQKAWSQGGTYTVAVRAFDIYGGESRQSFQVSVSDPLSSWTKITFAGFTDDLKAIAFGGGRFVAVGGYAACWSVDGRQWTRSTSGTSNMYAYSVAYGGGRFVAVGANWNSLNQTFYTAVFSSADGVSWSTATNAKADWLNSVTYGAGKFVAVGDAGTIWWSSDGQNWSLSQLTSRKNLKGVCFDGSVFLAVGEAGTAVYSRDGASWYDASISDATSDNGGISWFKDTQGSAVVSRDGGWYAMSSWQFNDLSAGISWSSQSLGRWQAVQRTYFPFKSSSPSLSLVAGGTSLLTFPSISGGPDVAFSTDGKSWVSYSLGSSSVGPLHGAVEANGRVVVVGDKGQIYISSDGSPAIASQPQGQTLISGSRLNLSVTAYATGPFTYQWRRNGAAIAGATSETFSIPVATTSDSGDYAVTITNSRGVVLSATASVSVQPATSAPVIVATPASQVITQVRSRS